jgi:hypothetical protein
MTSKEVSLDPDEFYRTNHMAEAAFLRMRGFATQSKSWQDGTCYWYFDKSDALMEVVDEYLSGKSLVEPKEYNRVFGIVKDELFLSDQFVRSRPRN